MNAPAGIPPGDVFGIGNPVCRSKSLDQAFFDPTVDMLGKASQGFASGRTSEIQQFRHGPSRSFKQSVDGIGLDDVESYFPNDLLFVFGKYGRNIAHTPFFSSLT